MSKLILILGGARSGKSNFAKRLVSEYSEEVIYIAIAQAKDKEMQRRIKSHKKNRPKRWKVIEEPKDLKRIKILIDKTCGVILFECLTLFVSNLSQEGIKEKNILSEIEGFIEFLRKKSKCAVFVSNEVGCGIVPDNAIARGFRDMHGRANQLVAELADEVYFVVAGIGVRIK